MRPLSPDERIEFPTEPNAWGIVASGGNLSPGMLLSAYEQGVFPWYDRPPILWHSPDPRFVLFLDEFHLPRRFVRMVRNAPVEVSFDRAFGRVMRLCARVPRVGQRGTWITREMVRGYTEIHALGHAHSVEVWRDEDLVGGLYGVAIGGIFAGESMFALEPDMSKVALTALVGFLDGCGVDLIDSQAETDHIARFGGREIPRATYLELLAERRDRAMIPSVWDGALAWDAVARGVDRALRNDGQRR